jgi:hypothetical protein
MAELHDIPPEKLQAIIGQLERYKGTILNRSSLSTQDPSRIIEIKALLSKKGSSIILFMKRSGAFVNDSADTNLNELLASLNNVINDEEGQDPRYSTIICDYVDKLFIQFPLTPSLSHIENLTKSDY